MELALALVAAAVPQVQVRSAKFGFAGACLVCLLRIGLADSEQRFHMSLQVSAGVPADSVEVLQDAAHAETGVQFASCHVGGRQVLVCVCVRVCIS